MSEVNLIKVPIAIHNLHGPDKNAGHRHDSIDALLDACKGGLGGYNEFNSKDSSYLRAALAKRKLVHFRYGQDGVVWDPSVFRKTGKPRVRKIMTGGHVGADGTSKGPDNRRVGPSRFGIYVPLEAIAIGVEFEADCTHPMARAFTVHKWRLPLFRKSIIELADGVLAKNGVMFGDMNDPHALNLPGVADVHVPAPPTMGHQHYDQILRWGNHIIVSDVKAVNTPSDHDMLKGWMTIYRSPQAHLTPPPTSATPTTPRPSHLPKPGTAAKWRRYRSPVAHPWAKKYNRRSFRKRRPRLYARIQRWKRAYRERL